MKTEVINDPDSYWERVILKRQLAQAFIENPSRQTLKELGEAMWAFQAYGSVDYYLDEHALNGQTPNEIASVFEDAIAAEEPERVTELRGFRWPSATEILRALEPEDYAILNTRSASGMDALGYSPPNPKSASPDQYAEFVGDVKEAATHYDLRTVAREGHGPIPDEITDLEVADGAFTRHYDGDVNLAETRESRVRSLLPDEMWREIEEEVDQNHRYRDVTDFLYSAVRAELGRVGQ